MGTENEDGEIRMYPINEGQQRIRQKSKVEPEKKKRIQRRERVCNIA
jgi:hypothetical protein